MTHHNCLRFQDRHQVSETNNLIILKDKIFELQRTLNETQEEIKQLITKLRKLEDTDKEEKRGRFR